MLRPIQKLDLELIFEWRNSPIVRNAMFSNNIISWEEHVSWFDSMTLDDTKLWFLYSDQNKTPHGVAYFTDIDLTQLSAFWGFYLRPNFEPGTGFLMLREVLDMAFNDLGLLKLNAYVLRSNLRSLKTHKRLGFIEPRVKERVTMAFASRNEAVRLVLSKSQWLSVEMSENAKLGNCLK
jgi:UDP-4-amino-4,6-dideoxy-N-acetyl-beta-L-altrosamine N-acetyltransferase